MNENVYIGSCYCKNISVTFTSTVSGSQLEPRSCDCDFCRKHGATYISDPNGSLDVIINNQNQINNYTQGSGTAKFVICQSCGVLAFVKYCTDNSIYATVNARILDDISSFKDSVVVSPRKLTKEEKISRWSKIWISQVTVKTNV